MNFLVYNNPCLIDFDTTDCSKDFGSLQLFTNFNCKRLKVFFE